jgi:hypothetical protein
MLEYAVVYLSCVCIGITFSLLLIHQDNEPITPEQTTITNLEKIYDEIYDNYEEEYGEEYIRGEEEKEEEEYYLNPLIYDISLCSHVNDSIPFYQSTGKSCIKRTKTPIAFKEEKRGEILNLKSCLKKT